MATESTTGSTSSHRVHVNLLIIVKSVDFDPKAGQLHVSGQVIEENKWVRIGAFHTLDLELHRNFSIEKKDGWDSVAVDALTQAIKQDKEGAIPTIVMQEGVANICLITEYQTILKQRIDMSVPKKRKGRSSEHDKGLIKFYKLCLEGVKCHFNLSQQRPFLIASPGFVAAGFHKYILDVAAHSGDREILENKKNFIVIHSSSGHLHSLNEVLRSEQVLSKLKDTKYAQETRLMDNFLHLLRKDDGRAWYGATAVEKAVEQNAVGRGGGALLINHSLFRSQEIEVRKRWVALVDKVKADGGEVRILSSDHESGKRLEGLGNIAAILTYPLHDFNDESQ